MSLADVTLTLRAHSFAALEADLERVIEANQTVISDDWRFAFLRACARLGIKGKVS